MSAERIDPPQSRSDRPRLGRLLAPRWPLGVGRAAGTHAETGAGKGRTSGAFPVKNATFRQFELSLPPRSADDVLKERAHMAALAHLAAVRDGDAELAAAAQARFEAASKHLAGQRKASR